ncbi:hypothetical protein IW262DRAFT_1353240 [Armillaria fumosa]|nr:hypothetical protein IW262DRAFT_1353240 [Armillaria fumosa]
MTSARHLAEGGSEALRALFNAIEPGADKNLSQEALQRLSEKLTEFSGAVDASKLSGNSGGEPRLNEEGLPIIDINEPDLEVGSSSNMHSAEPDLIPLSSLSPGELEVRRRERDRILDMLETEEETLERKTNEVATERRRGALQNMKEASREGAKDFSQTREMQKKMGKALLRNMAMAREEEEKEKAEREAEDLNKEKAKAKKGPQKTVTFAESEKDEEEEEAEPMHEWGDVAQGRLSSARRPTLLSKSNDSTLPMKMSVIERAPGQSNPPPEPPQSLADSDDESEPPPSEGSSSSDDPSDGDEEVEEGFDMDCAQHQREIALEYHKKRQTIGRDVSLAMRSHTHEEDEDQELPSGSTLRKKTPLSHFKSERLASSYGASSPSSSSSSPASQSLGACVLPASGAETLRNAVRMGKLDSDNHLVGGESDSEGDNEAVQEIIRLLEKGEAGPSKAQGSNTKGFILPENLPPLSPQTKPSKFKAARSQAGRPATPSSQSDSSTPVSKAQRSSPKLPPAAADAFPSMVMGSPSFPAGDVMSMLVESPSFPQPQTAPTSRPAVMSSAVRESSRPQRPPTVVPVSSMVKEASPSGSQPVAERKPPKKVSRFMAERS